MGNPQTPQSHFGPYEPWPTGAATQRGLFGQNNGFGNGGELEFNAIERSPSKNRGKKGEES